MSVLSPGSCSARHLEYDVPKGVYGCSRLSAVLNSGVLSKRGKALDVMTLVDNYGCQSNGLLEMNDADQKMLELFHLDHYAYLFATILEDAINELKILGECNYGLTVMHTLMNMKILRGTKYGVMEDPSDELSTVKQGQLENEEYALDKLRTDRLFFQNTMLMTYVEFVLHNSFECLAQQIATFLDRDSYRARLAAEEVNNKTTLRELVRQLRMLRKHVFSIHYSLDITIDELKARLEDSGLYAESRSRYVDRWERARTEQHAIIILKAETEPMDSLLAYKKKLEGENRVHAEVMQFISMDINETIDKVEAAMTKYDDDMENVDLRIQIMKNNYQTQVDVRQELEDKFEHQAKVIKEWMSFKQAREDLRKYREKMARAATVVQAWWRGLIVRLELGPFKPMKKGRRKPL